MKLNRLFGGASAAALAATARQVAVEDDEGSPAPVAPNDDDEDELPGEEQKPAAAAPAPAPAAAEPPAAPAPAAEAPTPPANAQEGEPLNLTAEQREIFNAGATARDMAYAAVFSARAKAADGTEGELLVAGREQAAVELMTDGLSADKTIKMLGKLPKGSAGDAMLANLRAEAGQAPALAPGGGEPAPAASPWAKAGKKLGWDKPENK
jgi:hypothetical protein